jgi:hypothetical protein
MRVSATRWAAALIRFRNAFFPRCCSQVTVCRGRRCYRVRNLPTEVVAAMNSLARLPVFAAALLLAAPGAHAFTFGNGGTTGGSGSNGGATSSYGSTLTTPGSGALATPEVKNFDSGNAGSLDGGTSGPSFRFGAGAGPFGAGSNQRLAPPAWVGDPLYFERGK